MGMGVDELVGLRCHEGFHTGIMCQGHQNGVSKGVVVLYIPRIGSVRTVWDEIFLNLRVSFDGLVIRKKVFLDSSHRI